MKTKVLFLITMLLGVLLFACAGAEKIGDYEYELNDDGTATIMKYIGQPAEELEVPLELVKKTKKSGETRITVTAIGNGTFAEIKKLKNVVIPEGITSIGADAFSKCENLVEVIIPEGVTHIGDGAFSGCALVTVSLPDSIAEIGSNPFADCIELKEIRISPDCRGLAVIDGVLFSKADKRLVCYPAGLEQDAYAIPNGIRSIGSNAFPSPIDQYDSVYDAWVSIQRGPSSLFIPGSVEQIADRAFFHRRNLSNVIIQDGVTSIGSWAFAGTALTTITIPNSVTEIGGFAFSECKNLVSVSLPNGITAIEQGTFYGCINLTSISLPKGLVRIGSQNPNPDFGAFELCESMTSIAIPDGVEVIGDRAFDMCSNLTSVTIPESVTQIGVYAFRKCAKLESVVIPDNVTSIGYGAFANCASLTSVVIPGSVTTIADGTFSAIERYNGNVSVSSSLKSVIIEEGVTDIGEGVFAGCDHLEEIVIPNTVTSIGTYAFLGCTSLTSLTIPDSVSEIENRAFLTLDYKPNTVITFIVSRDSYAAQYCKENGLNYTYPDSLDWLNN